MIKLFNSAEILFSSNEDKTHFTQVFYEKLAEIIIGKLKSIEPI
jgi:hypothetical protein